MEQFFIGRQPILNKHEKLFGYELLFRDASKGAANITDHQQATATVMANALNNIGFVNLVGDKKGFINVNTEILSSDFIELLPPERTVFEILENVIVDEKLIEICKYLKARGYSFALDDFQYDDMYLPLFEIADYIKLDLLAYDKDRFINIVKLLNKQSLKLLAEKVETKEDFKYCGDLGFEFFQGYFFAKPTIVTGTKVSPSQLTLFELFNSLSKEEDVDVIEKIFKRNPQLDIKMLKFINSASFYLLQKITSIRQAIMLLGYRNLQKWVALMLFAKDTQDIKSNPLLERAAIRGLIIELLTKKISNNRALSESGFIVGILSLTDALLGVPLKELLADLNLSQDIYAALANKEGLLGTMLEIVEKLENEEFDAIEEMLKTYKMNVSDLLVIETNAIIEYERSGKKDSN